MIKSHSLDENTGVLTITLELPLKSTGTYMLDESNTWTVPALAVYVNERYCEYTLNHTIYLDYKDSLQIGAPIIHFDSLEEALEFAKQHKLGVEYAV